VIAECIWISLHYDVERNNVRKIQVMYNLRGIGSLVYAIMHDNTIRY
jgi:hypothetical protein